MQPPEAEDTDHGQAVESDREPMQPREAQADVRDGIGSGEVDLSQGGGHAEVAEQAHRREEKWQDDRPAAAPEPSPKGGQGEARAGAAELQGAEHATHEMSGDLGGGTHREGGPRDEAERGEGAEPGAEEAPESRSEQGGRAGGRRHGARSSAIARLV